MKKGELDMWPWLGLILTLVILGLLLAFTQSGQDAIKPRLEEYKYTVPIGIVLLGRKK